MYEIVITGANGYLGSTIFNYLKSKDYKVQALIRKGSSTDRLPGLQKTEIIFAEDILTKRNVTKTYPIVIHCATLYKADKNFALMGVNIGFPIYVINNLLAEDGCFLNIDTSLDPRTNFYSETKNHFKELLKSYQEYFDFKTINIQLEYFFNEYEPENRFLTSLISACLKNEDFDLTAGDQIRDFIYLDDVCSAIVKILNYLPETDNDFCHFEVGSGAGVTIKDLAKTIKKLVGSNSDLNFGKIPYRDSETMKSVADISMLSKLGWEPEYTLELGLEMVIKKLQKRHGN